MNRTAAILAFAGLLLTAGAVWHPVATMPQLAADERAVGAAPPSGAPGAQAPDRRARGLDQRLATEAQFELNGELVDRILLIAEEIDPDMARRLREMCHHDPAEFERTIRTSGRKFIGLAELQQRDPALFELKISELRIERQVSHLEAQLDEAFRAGDESRVAGLENELRLQLMFQLALSIKSRGDYILRLQEHVRALEAEIEHEARHFDETIDLRMREVVERAQAKAATAGR